MSDFFDVLGVPRRFALESADLDRRFRELSQQVHPDRFVGAPAPERRRALEQATTLNDAYRTLKDPVRRAAYFLRQCGLSIDAEGPEGRSQVQLAPEFLGSFLELREVFEEDAKNPVARDELRTHLMAERARRVESLLRDLGAVPEGAERRVLLPLAQRLLELRYYDRFLEELEAEDDS